jgi:ABC-type multidrug transport system fused ATPase/permease subunit
MKLLLSYLRPHWKLVLLALLLATINQVFSLLDPLIFRHVIDQYATRFDHYTTEQFLRGVSLLLLAAVGVAFVSRVAKNFQDYFLNVVTQRLGRGSTPTASATRSSCPTSCSRTRGAARRSGSCRRSGAMSRS